MRTLMLLLVMCTPAAIAANAPVAAVQGGYVALSVADLDASAKWYAETFDLAIVPRRDYPLTHELFLELLVLVRVADEYGIRLDHRRRHSRHKFDGSLLRI